MGPTCITCVWTPDYASWVSAARESEHFIVLVAFSADPDIHSERGHLYPDRQTDKHPMWYPSLVHFPSQEGKRTIAWHHFLPRTITQERVRDLQKCCPRHNKPDHGQENTPKHTYRVHTDTHSTQWHHCRLQTVNKPSLLTYFWCIVYLCLCQCVTFFTLHLSVPY